MSTSFSFVVPACNVAPYLEPCIRSLQAQTLPDFEALIVCEKSTDGTLELAQKLTAEDPRFRVIPLPKSGSASASRNYGINHASGDYLLFIDGDDWIEPTTLECFKIEIETHHFPDVLNTSYVNWKITDNGCVQLNDERVSRYLGESFHGQEALARLLEEGSFIPATWSHVYKRTHLLQNALYQKVGRRHQDDEWTPRVYFFAQHVVVTNFAYYHYRKRPESVTTKSSEKTLTHFTQNLIDAFDFYNNNVFTAPLQHQWALWHCLDISHYFSRGWRHDYSVSARKKAFYTLMNHRSARATYFSLIPFAHRRDRLFVFAVRFLLLTRLFSLGDFFYDLIYMWLPGRKK